MKNFPLYDVPYYDNFYDMVTRSAQLYGDKPALAQYSRKGDLSVRSYNELRDDVLDLAETLCQSGLAGHHIAVAAENSYQWIVAFLAITASGGVNVSIDIEQSDEVIRSMILQGDSVAVFVSPSLREICKPLINNGLRLIGLDDPAQTYETLDSLVDQGRRLRKAGERPIMPVSLDPGQVAAIVYTSGTTSTSKPVMLTQKGMLTNATEAVRITAADNDFFTSLPLYHAMGITLAVLDNLICGQKITVNGNLKTTMRDMYLAQPGNMVSVPLIMEAVHKHIWHCIEQAGKTAEVTKLVKLNLFLKKFGLSYKLDVLRGIKEKCVGKLAWTVCGGAHVNPELIENLELFGITILQGYGITECAPLISVNSNRGNRPGSVGHIVPSSQVRFDDGEVLVKGVCVMKGYYKAPELTAEVFDGEWFRTGDLGYQDKDGYLYITGRKKNLIVFKNGKKISPENLENQLSAIPLVKEVVVTGATSGNSADDVKVAATICPDPAYTIGMSSYEILETLQAEVDKINAKLPIFQQIQLINIRDTEFEKTSSKKIKRNTV